MAGGVHSRRVCMTRGHAWQGVRCAWRGEGGRGDAFLFLYKITKPMLKLKLKLCSHVPLMSSFLSGHL